MIFHELSDKTRKANRERHMKSILLASMCLNSELEGWGHIPKEEPDWDSIKKEYDLIQEKKSDLPRSYRDKIVKLWEKRNPEDVRELAGYKGSLKG